MLKNLSSVFVVTAALTAGAAFAQEGADRSVTPPKVVIAKKEVVDQTKPMDVVDTTMKAGSFKTLAALLKNAELVETLKGKGPFTVFAPRTKPLPSCQAVPSNLCLRRRTKKS